MNKELAVLLTMKKKFQGLINTFTDIINSTAETNYYVNSFKTNDNKNNKLNSFIEMYNDTFDEKQINETMNELKLVVNALDIEIYNTCQHCFTSDHIEDQFGKVTEICYCETCGLNKDIYSI